MNWDADVYKGGRLVAHFRRTPTGSELHFVVTQTEERLAWQIPYQDQPLIQAGANLPPFFANLLPEGARLEMLLSSSKIARDDLLGLLLKVGWDTVGDVSVLPADAPPHKAQSDAPEPEEMDFTELLDREEDDAAVPGIQEKLSSQVFSLPLPTRSWPAAILKLNPRRYPRLVQNEEFFLRMAKDCGLKVNEARLVKDRNGQAGLLIRRFDRTRAPRSKVPTKLHQEDACQLLGHWPANKYHLSIQEIAGVFREICTAPVVEVRGLIRLYAFSFLIGNGDLHGKNVSLLWKDGIVALSPGYDLLSTLPYPQMDQHMALKLDGRDDNFKPSYFIQFGSRYGVSEKAIREDLAKMTERAGKWIDRLDEIGLSPEATKSTRDAIHKRRERLAAD